MKGDSRHLTKPGGETHQKKVLAGKMASHPPPVPETVKALGKLWGDTIGVHFYLANDLL